MAFPIPHGFGSRTSAPDPSRITSGEALRQFCARLREPSLGCWLFPKRKRDPDGLSSYLPCPCRNEPGRVCDYPRGCEAKASIAAGCRAQSRPAKEVRFLARSGDFSFLLDADGVVLRLPSSELRMRLSCSRRAKPIEALDPGPARAATSWEMIRRSGARASRSPAASATRESTRASIWYSRAAR
jgi:hypothetical protein